MLVKGVSILNGGIEKLTRDSLDPLSDNKVPLCQCPSKDTINSDSQAIRCCQITFIKS
jgi:hypothetical protein